jgi:RecG-like helicase
VGVIRKFLDRFTESDEERLASSVQAWAETIPGTVRVAEAPSRAPVKLAVTVKRISLVPGEHHDSLEALLTDGTGEVTGVWIGRRSIPGLQLGTRMVVKGVLSKAPTPRRMVNPAYEFASPRP